MTVALNETHDPAQRSFVESANAPGGEFPIQNLPLGVFRPAAGGAPRIGVAIGDQILDLAAAAPSLKGLGADLTQAAAAPRLNQLMALGPQAWSALRLALSRGLRADGGDETLRTHLEPAAHAQLLLPVAIGDFTDFYASVFHASNVGRMLRPDPLMPNYKYVPVAYHGRASSVCVSGTPLKRPRGQRKRANETVPSYGPARNLDFELELGFYIGPASALGATVPIRNAAQHIFGFCLLNDWSARDIQGWEYQPLGPFLGKNFGTTVSAWVVTQEALAPFRVPAYARPEGDPAPLSHLDDADDRRHGALGLTLEAYFSSAAMRKAGTPPYRLTHASLATMYWTVAQMVAHHTSNGCNLATGDLFGSGTVSGPEKSSQGCLLELTLGGREPLPLPSGETRGFLEDGDEIIFRGFAERPGYPRIGFGECRAVIMPAG